MLPSNRLTSEKNPSTPSRNSVAKYWILILLALLALVPLTAGRVNAAKGTSAPIGENILVAPSNSPTGNPTATRTRVPTATITPRPTATRTPTLAAPLQTMVKVAVRYASLRQGPGTNYSVIRSLEHGELLEVLGRLEDKSHLYVETSEGERGWLPTTWVKITWTNVDYYPIEIPPLPPEATVKAASILNLRTVPVMESSFVAKLEYGDPMTVLGWVEDRTWLYVKSSDGKKGWVKSTWVSLGKVNLVSGYYPVQTPPPTETSTPVILTNVEGHWIDIDLSEQTLRAYDGTQLMGTFLVSTGIQQYPTVAGQFHIYAKFDLSVMAGRDYYLPDVPWSMYYSGDFSIHGTYWHHNFGKPMSHGCVNMDIKDAGWLYEFAPLGTLVNIHY